MDRPDGEPCRAANDHHQRRDRRGCKAKSQSRGGVVVASFTACNSSWPAVRPCGAPNAMVMLRAGIKTAIGQRTPARDLGMGARIERRTKGVNRRQINTRRRRPFGWAAGAYEVRAIARGWNGHFRRPKGDQRPLPDCAS
jgi:hypothetical protein